MKIAVTGLGHVGLVTGLTFSAVGHDVAGVDCDQERVRLLSIGRVPFSEPGIEQLLEDRLHNGFEPTTDLAEALRDAALVFVCVGTPARPSGDVDVSQIGSLAVQMAPHLAADTVVVEKSTVPSGTGDHLARTLRRELGRSQEIASNPEFLSEGTALSDSFAPQRIVLGVESDRAANLLMELYRPIIENSGCNVLVTNVKTAELIKHASNAFLATKISFINAVAEICERVDADVEMVARGMGLDRRIGSAFLQAGAGYGGSCFPKDVAGFSAMASYLGVDFGLLNEVQAINRRAPLRLVEKLKRELWVLKGKRIAVLGLAYKAGTDDVREAPALKLIDLLQKEEAEVVAYDPAAVASAKEMLDSVHFSASTADALTGCDAAVIVTDWPEFRGLRPLDFKTHLRHPIVIDGRNLFSPDEMARAGVTYVSTGRPRMAP